jgi:hypothetical protein
LGATDDGGMSTRRNVVAGYIAVSVYPLVDAKCGVSVELLNLICLAIEEILERNRICMGEELT